MSIPVAGEQAGKIVAVAVSYHPAPDEIEQLLAATLPQVAAFVLVDNGSYPPVEGRLPDDPRVHCLSLGDNLGIAAAQNRGIDLARRLGATHVLLLDQDSIPAPGCVARLAEAHRVLEEEGVRVAAVGPRFTDPRLGDPHPFACLRGLGLAHRHCRHEDEIIPVDVLISSGSLISVACLDALGGFDESLFLYYVDNEWCLRALTHGYHSYGVCAARMSHRHGAGTMRILGRLVPLRAPLMHYYLFRNAVLLYRRAWVPWRWRVVDGYRIALKYFFYALFARPRGEHFRMMSLGLWHGLRGRGGRFDQACGQQGQQAQRAV